MKVRMREALNEKKRENLQVLAINFERKTQLTSIHAGLVQPDEYFAAVQILFCKLEQ